MVRISLFPLFDSSLRRFYPICPIEYVCFNYGEIMSKHLKNLFIAMGLAILATSCGVEEFASKKNKDSLSTNPITTNTTSGCSQFTYIKPKVDFLFLWDNSSSAVFINDQTRQALNQTIDLISNRFDYHIVLAPLVLPNGASVNSYAGLIVSDTPSGQLTSKALSMRIDRSAAQAHLDSFTSFNVGSAEYGTQRAIDFINNNKTTGSINEAFRREAHTIVVLMSTEDDDASHNNLQSFVSNRVSQLNSIRDSLDSIQLRFFSIVRKNICNQNFAPMYPSPYNLGYRQVSEQNFYSQSPIPSDVGGNRDSFDLCAVSDFTRVFDGINNSIQDFILGHKYNYWPVAQSGANIDPNEITVTKDGISYPRLSEPVSSGTSGFTFTNMVQTVNTRFEPEPGEPFTGYVVRLYGNAQVTYPECMSVRTQTVKEWYGYVHLQSKPVESSLQVKVDGSPISSCGASNSSCPSSCNGYVLMKSGGQPQYQSNRNIRIVGPQGSNVNYTPVSPGIVKSGYFLQMCGNAIYSNGANVDVIYDPSS